MIQLYDNESRSQMFKNLDSSGHDEEYYITNKDELIEDVCTNSFYKSLCSELQKKCIKGENLRVSN